MSDDQRKARLRVAARRMFTDGRGGLNKDAKILVGRLRKFCGHGDSPARFGPGGQGDMLATGIAIGRLEVFQFVERLLLVDPVEIYSATEREFDE